jgi:universal stress protein E
VNEALRKQHAKALRELVADRRIASERVHLREGIVRNELRNLAQSLPASLLVMGAVARSALRRVFIGSTAARVLESLPCDALIVKPEGFVTPVELHRQAPLFTPPAVAD